jgi:uncharacterized protein YjbJ (UPF0337 family)
LETVHRQGQREVGKLTEDDIVKINGNREQLEGELQAKYGHAKDKAKQEVDNWIDRL